MWKYIRNIFKFIVSTDITQWLILIQVLIDLVVGCMDLGLVDLDLCLLFGKQILNDLFTVIE